MDNVNMVLLPALIRSGLRSEPLAPATQAALTLENLPKLTALAKKFDLEHLLALGLQTNGIRAQESQKSMLVAAFRCQRLQDAQRAICDALEKGQIPFLPLKGAVLRQAYPEPWMRTSCDIDILVHPQDLQRAAGLLEALGYTRQKLDSHDLSLHSPQGVHLELHYSLLEKELIQNADTVLKQVWDRAVLTEGTGYHYKMPDDLFYCYHIAHMAKHFAIGGCGVRPVLDLWLLDGLDDADHARRDALLEQAGLLKFAQTARALSQGWFDGEDLTPLADQMGQYILRGGLYCDNANRIAIQQHKQGGRLRYLLARIFLPFDILKFRYPVLQKHPWLAPVMHLRRWIHLVFGGQLGRVRRDLAYGRQISEKEEEDTRIFLENIGLIS